MKIKKIENEKVKAALVGASLAIGITATTVVVYRMGEVRSYTRLINLVGKDALLDLIKNAPAKL